MLYPDRVSIIFHTQTLNLVENKNQRWRPTDRRRHCCFLGLVERPASRVSSLTGLGV